MRKPYQICLSMFLVCLVPAVASAQSFRVQCPTSTITHPTAANNNSEPAYVGPTYAGTAGYPAAPAHVNGAIKCQQISGGDGYASMGDGTQTRSEEHTSELQSRSDLVCRLLLEKKKPTP